MAFKEVMGQVNPDCRGLRTKVRRVVRGVDFGEKNLVSSGCYLLCLCLLKKCNLH